MIGLFLGNSGFLGGTLREAFAATAARKVYSPFLYRFHVPGTLEEAGDMDSSSSPYFWLNSGAKLLIKDNVGMTAQGELSLLEKWRRLYVAANPLDTDGGYHPQNIFRLVTRQKWQDVSQEAYFRIRKDNLSPSPNRNQSNGLLLMSRYQDSATLYYAGVRVDGRAVIKKKYHGTYSTLALKPIFPGTYDRTTNPNLIPAGEWIGLKSATKNNPDGTVTITLLMDRGHKGVWTSVLKAVDNAQTYGPAIAAAGCGGIRTDFMDVEFDDYRFLEI